VNPSALGECDSARADPHGLSEFAPVEGWRYRE